MSDRGIAPVGAATLKVLAFTNLFPNPQHPAHGIFLRHRLQHLGQCTGMALRIVVPTPWFPLSGRLFGKYGTFARVPSHDILDGILVRYPRYLIIPKIGMWLSPLTMAFSLAKEIKRLEHSGFKPDMIDAYYLYPDGVAASLVGWWSKTPVMLTALGSDVSQIAQQTIPGMMVRWALRRAKATTAVCKALVDALTDLGTEPQKLHVVEHGVDLELFDMPVDRAAVRKAAGFDGFTILSAGHLISRKGHDLAIEAIHRMPDVNLVIVGDGPDRQALEAQADRLGVSSRVRFTGQVDQTRLADLLGATDLLINCSDREGIANVLLEALACGTPIAATPVWGSPEVIVNEDIGVMFEARTVDAIANGIAAAKARPWDRDAIRQHAMRYSWRETAENHYCIMIDDLDPIRCQ